MKQHEAFEILPPEGYHPSYAFRYPKMFTYIPLVLYVITSLIYYVIWRLIRHSFFVGIAASVIFWIVVLTWLIVDVLRVCIQGGVSRLLGYHISLHVMLRIVFLETYTADPGQFQKRGHVLLIALAPLGICMLLWIPLLVGVQESISDVLAFLLIVNIAKAVGDLYLSWRLIQMPRGTLLYNVNLKEKYIFEPNSIRVS